MKAGPAISVIMPVYNGEKYLSEAIQSVLDQTFSDFEFIIINDGSTDGSAEIIKSFSDPRIVYIDNGKNLGLAMSFNAGIDAARGRYIARMDADDISLPDRFAKQISFLRRKPHVGIIGSSIFIIDESGKQIAVHRRPESHLEIKFGSLFSSPMYHPTVMGRSEIFKGHHYNETFSNSEDYELWSRLLFGTDIKFANITEPLLKYRVFPQSFTQSLNLDRRALSAHNTIKNVEQYLKLSKDEKDFIIHLRQERLLGLKEFFLGLFLYIKAMVRFILKEAPGIRETLGIESRYINFAVTLVKFQIKKLVRK